MSSQSKTHDIKFPTQALDTGIRGPWWTIFFFLLSGMEHGDCAGCGSAGARAWADGMGWDRIGWDLVG